MQVTRQALPFLDGALGLRFSQNDTAGDIHNSTDLVKRLLVVINKITTVNYKSIRPIGAEKTIFVSPVIFFGNVGVSNTLNYPVLVLRVNMLLPPGMFLNTITFITK